MFLAAPAVVRAAPDSVWRQACLWMAMATPTAAELDVVYVQAANEDPPRKVSGEVLAYTRQTVKIRTRAGRERSIPRLQVVSVETNWSEPYQQAERAFQRGAFVRARRAYEEALALTERDWVREWMAARLVWCWRAEEQWERAAQAFLVLAQDAPDTAHIAAMPLVWSGSERIDASVSSVWMESSQSKSARLIGASHCLATSEDARARQTLETMVNDPDAYLAGLAAMQLWRTDLTVADACQPDAWHDFLERQPWEIRAGGFYLLGQGWRRRSNPQRAAEAFLRIPIHYPRRVVLVGSALVAAGDALRESGEQQAASRLWREVVEHYARTYWTTQAAARLRDLAADQPQEPDENR